MVTLSAELALDELDVDLEGNTATASLTLDVGELFDENGELRLWEDDDWWSGFALDDGVYYAVDISRPDGDWLRKIRVGERAVRLAVQEHIEDPDAGGAGQFVRGARP